jgi:DNA-binding IclR family transcriptional regulator
LEAVLQGVELAPLTPNTITSKSDLLRELKRIRARGFATNNEETHIGVRSVAAPVRNSSGEVVASVNIIVPTIRSSRKELETVLAEKVIAMADRISAVLGYRGLNRTREAFD